MLLGKGGEYVVTVLKILIAFGREGYIGKCIATPEWVVVEAETDCLKQSASEVY